MNKYTTGEIADMVGGELQGPPGEPVGSIGTDSRTIHPDEATPFCSHTRGPA